MKLKDIKNIKLILAIFVVAIVWGTTFLGIKIAVETIPPWFVSGLRQFFAGLILLLYLLISKKLRWLGWKTTMQQFLISGLMLISANGLTTVAVQYVDSSLASLVSSCSPILIFILSAIFIVKKIKIRSLIGVLMGFCGIVFVFWNGLENMENVDYQKGLTLLFLAVAGWSIGTVYSKKTLKKNADIILLLFYQFSFAGVVQLIFALLFSSEIDIQSWNITSILAVIYLSVFGSIIAFFCFNYLLQKLLPTQVAVLSYLNTIVAIFLGWLILNEEITIKFVIAAILIISGVFVTNYKTKNEKL
ncbi:DMT family transporter [Frigoriflavimonas asaccharolytica]|uniref:Drug/metabolite transporter (DMT)-like permease n=1 Tax=Frigoriflavimonas asaccharolytica TaxID=2735899 RepID=A0A8J8GAS1_9FLAO|nr:EamA family transporter [Frigoriflavimonas asaccharolytica]NRS92774.1 drug/metabolite transporter (DMT)-like permease [Frigoriflavimonas asaccharolytica]